MKKTPDGNPTLTLVVVPDVRRPKKETKRLDRQYSSSNLPIKTPKSRRSKKPKSSFVQRKTLDPVWNYADLNPQTTNVDVYDRLKSIQLIESLCQELNEENLLQLKPINVSGSIDHNIKQKIMDGGYNIIISQKKWERGIDLGQIGNLIFIRNMPYGAFLQNMGRGIRKWGETECLVIDMGFNKNHNQKHNCHIDTFLENEFCGDSDLRRRICISPIIIPLMNDDNDHRERIQTDLVEPLEQEEKRLEEEKKSTTIPLVLF